MATAKKEKDPTPVEAYHFLRENMRADRGYEPAWEIGETRTIAEDGISLCLRGYHSSSSWYKSKTYVSGHTIACRVRVSKPVDKDGSKQVSAVRTLVEAIDIDAYARDYARKNKPIISEKEKKQRAASANIPTFSKSTLKIVTDFTQGKVVSSDDLEFAVNEVRDVYNALYDVAYYLEDQLESLQDNDPEWDIYWEDLSVISDMNEKQFNAWVEAGFKSGKYHVGDNGQIIKPKKATAKKKPAAAKTTTKKKVVSAKKAVMKKKGK